MVFTTKNLNLEMGRGWRGVYIVLVYRGTSSYTRITHGTFLGVLDGSGVLCIPLKEDGQAKNEVTTDYVSTHLMEDGIVQAFETLYCLGELRVSWVKPYTTVTVIVTIEPEDL